jgi:type I restriction enzyme R subunit
VVLEAKSEDKNPLIGKEQARKYAKSQNCRFVILSNGNLHYFWDLEQGNPHIITRFPSPDSIKGYHRFQPNPQKLITEQIGKDYIALTQMPGYAAEASWNNPAERDAFIQKNRLRFLRDYQKRAISAIQDAVAEGHSRFLFEMATGTGKTLTAAAVIKLFLRTGNAAACCSWWIGSNWKTRPTRHSLPSLKNDYTSVIYKERRDEWRKAEIVVTTVQSLLFNDKYRRLFSPTDFDLVISDEAHRSIGGNARAVFEYFVGYKLGLTATPRDYLKKFRRDRSWKKRQHPRPTRGRAPPAARHLPHLRLRDPASRRSAIPCSMACAKATSSTRWWSMPAPTSPHSCFPKTAMPSPSPTTPASDQQESLQETRLREEASFPRPPTALVQDLPGKRPARPGQRRDGQVHRLRRQPEPRRQADPDPQPDWPMRLYPGKYQSDFAVQVTSLIPTPSSTPSTSPTTTCSARPTSFDLQDQQGARLRHRRHDDHRLRLPDILNLGLLRPIFSPTDFMQIKGRGTRKHDFREQLFDDALKAHNRPRKTAFKLFDFFANCEYFEKEFNYDEVLKLPRPGAGEGSGENAGDGGGTTVGPNGEYIHGGSDAIAHMAEQPVGPQGMKIDRMFFEGFENTVKADPILQQQVDNEQWDQAIDYVTTRLLDKPAEFYTLDKLRRAAGVDRRLTLREILEKIFGLIPYFKSRTNCSKTNSRNSCSTSRRRR